MTNNVIQQDDPGARLWGPEYSVWDIREKTIKSLRYKWRNGKKQDIDFDNDCEDEETFIAKMYIVLGDKPGPKYSIDRIDNNGHYTSDNVRWATSRQQCRNTSKLMPITYRGEVKTFGEWCRLFKIDIFRAHARFRRHREDLDFVFKQITNNAPQI